MRKLTTEQFIDRAKKIHGDRYDYSKSIYINSRDKLIIRCSVHGDFSQSPHTHLAGKGCLWCNRTFNRLHPDKFAERVKKSSPNIKIISKYKDWDSKVLVEDLNGYLYNVSPSSLIAGYAPTIQTAVDKSDTFKQMAINIHGEKYKYESVKYIDTHSKVIITCPIHGNFEQEPATHLSGSGCDKCGFDRIKLVNQESPNGWTLSNWIKASTRSKNFTGYKVYIINCFNENESFIKIGRTFQDISRRYAGNNSIQYDYKIIKEIHGNAHYIFYLENKLKKIVKDYKYLPQKPFKGQYECFTLDSLNLLKDRL